MEVQNAFQVRVFNMITGDFIGRHETMIYNMTVMAIPKGWRPRTPRTDFVGEIDDHFHGCFIFGDVDYVGPLDGWACTVRHGFGNAIPVLSQSGNNDVVSLVVTPDFLVWRSPASRNESRVNLARLQSRDKYRFPLHLNCAHLVSPNLVYASLSSKHIIDMRFEPPKVRRLGNAIQSGLLYFFFFLLHTWAAHNLPFSIRRQVPNRDLGGAIYCCLSRWRCLRAYTQNSMRRQDQAFID